MKLHLREEKNLLASCSLFTEVVLVHFSIFYYSVFSCVLGKFLLFVIGPFKK